MELAVRPAKGGGHLYGSQNTSELRQLCRVTPAKARLRALLLIDLYKTPLPSERLKATYDVVHAGRGRFSRTAVRVVYTHAEIAYDFLWRPFRQ